MKVLAVGAPPDGVEILCAGALAKHSTRRIANRQA